MCIQNSSVMFAGQGSTNIILKRRALIVVVAFTFVTIAGINHFLNTLLSPLTVSKSSGRKCQLKYKQANFVYLVVIGFVIFFSNQLSFSHVHCSLVVLIIHSFYIFVLYQINPYQKSLMIHTYGLYLNQLIYLLFLLYVNLVNFIGDAFPQVLSLIIVYFILATCFVLMAFTITRLYYEYRYGEEL